MALSSKGANSVSSGSTFGTPRRRWVGVLLSLLVPGFGLVRAGRFVRAVAWFLAIQALGVAVALLAIWRSVPFCVVLAAFFFALVLQIAMLVDSFKPGKLAAPLWVVFGILALAGLYFPPPLSLCAGAFKMSSASMEPTLQGAALGTPDHVFVDRLSYRFSTPRRGDLLVFWTAGIDAFSRNTLFIQRLIGLPGEKIEIRDGRVFADGRALNKGDGIPDELYTVPNAVRSPSAGNPGIYEVPPDCYFTLGDNSARSFDGRYWGVVPKENVYGRVSRIYYPFSRVSVPK